MNSDYCTLEDLARFGYDAQGYETLAIAKIHEFSEMLRAEATNRDYLIDLRVSEDEDYSEVVKSVICKLTYKAITDRKEADVNIGSEYEGVESLTLSSGAQGYSESKSIKFRSGENLSTSTIPRSLLNLLTFGGQKITREVL